MQIKGTIFLVGGAVRDELLGKPVNDHDYVVVGGSQENLLANGFKQVGAAFPVFLHPDTGAEYALARTERKTGLGYGGFEVLTDGVTLEEDLGRRDFTINAMAKTADGTLVDPFGGAHDIAQGMIRHVSNAFKDDPLRVLRAARFAARYNFKIANDTVAAAKEVSRAEFDALSAERIFLELQKAANDRELPFFLRRLKELDAAHVLSRVMCAWDVDKLSTPIGPFSSDALLAAMCINAADKNMPLADFQGLTAHRELATHWLAHDVQHVDETAAASSLLKLLSWAGTGSKFAFLCDAVDATGWPMRQSSSHLKEAAAVISKVTSTSVLMHEPTLVGPALGAAIKAARTRALEFFF